MNVNSTNFMWLTRGKSWGFRFLSEPSGLSSAMKIYKSVFGPDEERIGYWKGNFFENNTRKYYAACRCYDEKNVITDEAGRRIPHEFLIICSEAEQKYLSGLQWGPVVMEKIREDYEKRYPLEYTEVKKCEVDFELVLSGMLQEDACMEENVPCDAETSSDHCAEVGADRIHTDSLEIARRRVKSKEDFLWLLFFLFVGCIVVVTCLCRRDEQKTGCNQNEDIIISGKTDDVNTVSSEINHVNPSDSVVAGADETILKEENGQSRNPKP